MKPPLLWMTRLLSQTQWKMNLLPLSTQVFTSFVLWSCVTCLHISLEYNYRIKKMLLQNYRIIVAFNFFSLNIQTENQRAQAHRRVSSTHSCPWVRSSEVARGNGTDSSTPIEGDVSRSHAKHRDTTFSLVCFLGQGSQQGMLWVSAKPSIKLTFAELP